MTVWFFLDLMSISTYLGINQGLSDSTFLLVLLFILGFLVTIMLDPHSRLDRFYDPIFLAALVIAIHGIGEGIAIGSTLAYPTVVDPIAATGGPISAASFVIHKTLEAFIVTVLAVSTGRYYSHLIGAGLILSVPTVLGAIAGYLLSINATVFYAIAGGGTLWLLSTLISTSMTMPSRFKWSLSLLLGVLLMFLAGTLHSTR